MHPLVPVVFIIIGLVIMFLDCRRMGREQFFAYVREKIQWWFGYLFCAAIVIGALVGFSSLSKQAMLWANILSMTALAIAVFLIVRKNKPRDRNKIPPALRGKL